MGNFSLIIYYLCEMKKKQFKTCLESLASRFLISNYVQAD